MASLAAAARVRRLNRQGERQRKEVPHNRAQEHEFGHNSLHNFLMRT
jgi:hypothetical protein